LIDLHCHILPGVDDGAENIDMSRRMLQRAREFGFTTIVATPHLTALLDLGYEQRVRWAFDQVLPIAHELGITLVPGYEIRLTPDLGQRLRNGEQAALGTGRTVLVDLACVELPHFVDEALFAIQTAGYQPVLAHPERYPDFQRDPRLGLELAERGVALQVTIGSLAGAFGTRARKTAEALLRLGAVHLVATDAHSDGQRMAAVPEGLRRLRAMLGAEQYRRALLDNPQMLLAGMLPDPIEAAEQSFWNRVPLLRR